MRLGGLFLCEEISNRVGVKNASSEKEKCSPMEDDDDDNDASDRASFFSPMLSRQAAPRPRSVGPLRVAVGRSVRRSERRSAFPCFSYFMIPKREWERIDYNDGHQATTIEQKKYGYLCMPHCRCRTIRGRYSGVPNRLLCTFILFQDCFHPLSPTWNYCLVLKFSCIFGLFFCCTLTAQQL